MSEVTRILSRLESGDPRASEELLPLVYEELRKLAQARMAAERPDHTLQATALVHEAYSRLVDKDEGWESRGHFFSAAAEAMRRILVENARRQDVRRRHGLADRVALEAVSPSEHIDGRIIELNQALTELEDRDDQAARLVKLRYFAGLGHEEAANAMGISRRAADRLWTVARAWLSRELTRD